MMKKQRGVTMIELLISMVLGLSLVASIGQLFVQSQKSFRLQRNLSDMTDDASFILESLAKGVLLAGYAEAPQNAFSTADLNIMPVSGIANISLDSGEFVKGTDTQLVYRYKLGYGVPANGGTQIPDGCKTDKNPPNRNGACELDNFVGTSTLSGVKDDMVTVRIYKKSDDGIPVFYSKSKLESVINNTVTVEDAQPLISEVEKLEFRYGIRIKCYENRTTGLCEKIENKATNEYKSAKDSFLYTTAASVDALDPITNKNNWTNVIAVKVFVVMRSVDDNLVRTQQGYTIGGVQQNPLPTDRRLYKTFSKTVFLRSTKRNY